MKCGLPSSVAPDIDGSCPDRCRYDLTRARRVLHCLVSQNSSIPVEHDHLNIIKRVAPHHAVATGDISYDGGSVVHSRDSNPDTV